MWLILPLVFLLIIFLIFRRFYLESARDVQRLEATSRLQLIINLHLDEVFVKCFIRSESSFNPRCIYHEWFDDIARPSIAAFFSTNIRRLARCPHFCLVHETMSNVLVRLLALQHVYRLYHLRHLHLRLPTRQ